MPLCLENPEKKCPISRCFIKDWRKRYGLVVSGKEWRLGRVTNIQRFLRPPENLLSPSLTTVKQGMLCLIEVTRPWPLVRGLSLL